ncbi:hypothetical protein ACWDUN_27815 [Mycobacterium sp. NPDC003323]
MTSALRATDRVLTAVLAVLLLAGAAWLIGYGLDAPFARDAAARIDAQAIAAAPDWPWWSAALGAGGITALVVGAWLVLLHLRPRSVHAVSTAHVGAVDLTRLADAAATDLGKHPSVGSAKASTRTVAGRAVVRITAEIPASTPRTEIRSLARRCADDVRRAADADVEFQLLVKPMPAARTRRGLT